jgi:hypothetical protein
MPQAMKCEQGFMLLLKASPETLRGEGIEIGVEPDTKKA